MYVHTRKIYKHPNAGKLYGNFGKRKFPKTCLTAVMYIYTSPQSIVIEVKITSHSQKLLFALSNVVPAMITQHTHGLSII